jgi:cullin 1
MKKAMRTDGLRQAELKLEDEERRIPLYLLNELRGPLIAACEQALVGSHMDVIRNEFDSLLQNNHHKHLGRLYRLVARIPGGLDPLRDQFESHVQKAGLDAVEAACESGRDIEPETYVVVLSNVLAAYEGIVSHCFNGETEFKTSLVRVCRSFVNCNKSCVSGSSKSPELLARFTNTVLVESSAKSFDEAETECKLGRIVSST